MNPLGSDWNASGTQFDRVIGSTTILITQYGSSWGYVLMSLEGGGRATVTGGGFSFHWNLFDAAKEAVRAVSST